MIGDRATKIEVGFVRTRSYVHLSYISLREMIDGAHWFCDSIFGLICLTNYYVIVCMMCFLCYGHSLFLRLVL